MDAQFTAPVTRYFGKSRSDVDTIAEHVALLDDDVTDMHAVRNLMRRPAATS